MVIDTAVSTPKFPSWKVHLMSVGLLLIVVSVVFLPVLLLMVTSTDYQPLKIMDLFA